MPKRLADIGTVILSVIGIGLGAAGVWSRLPVWSIWVGGGLLVVAVALVLAQVLAPDKAKGSVSQSVSGTNISGVVQSAGDVTIRNSGGNLND